MSTVGSVSDLIGDRADLHLEIEACDLFHFERDVAAFLLGLGMTTKLLFLWFLVALGLCACMLFWRPLLQARHDWSRNLVRWGLVSLASLSAFCAGAFPFLLYNAMTRGTLRLLLSSSGAETTTHGVNNSAFLRNLWTEADAFKVLLDGGYFWFQGNNRIYANPLTPPLFALSALGLLALVLGSRGAFTRESFSRVKMWAGLLLGGVLVAVALGVAHSAAGSLTTIAIGAALATGLLGTLGLLLAGWRSTRRLPTIGWLLLASGTVSGAVWWFGGAGRPEGTDPGGPFGLWPVDACGILFWASGAALLALLGADTNPVPRQRLVTALLALIGLVVAQSSVTVSGLWSTHLLVLLPLPQIVIAAFAVELGRRLVARQGAAIAGKALRARLALIPALVVVGAVALVDLGVDYSYHRDMQITGGSTTFSDTIYGLASYLENDRQHPRVVAMDWGFRRPVQLLTKERVDPIEAYGYAPGPTEEFRRGVRELITESNTLYQDGRKHGFPAVRCVPGGS